MHDIADGGSLGRVVLHHAHQQLLHVFTQTESLGGRVVFEIKVLPALVTLTKSPVEVVLRGGCFSERGLLEQ